MAHDKSHSTAHIVQSLIVNVVIAAVKAVAAYFTGSGAMLAEALHSFSDCGNQVLLLIGVRQARKPADARHPFGYGRAVYFWSFMVALMLFLGGGAFSVYEGIHKLREPEPVHQIWLGLLILGVSLVLEGGALRSNIKELNRRRGTRAFMRYLRETTEADLVVVFAENAAAVLGLALALAALGAAAVTGDGRWDGIGGIAIGLVLVGVAAFLGIEVSSLLLGEAAAPDIVAVVHATVAESPAIQRVLNVVTMQQGPGEVLVHLKIAFVPTLNIEEACRHINDLEARLRRARPEIRWVFVEPDVPR
jgi:cation diffusion facilitator family transporter